MRNVDAGGIEFRVSAARIREIPIPRYRIGSYCGPDIRIAHFEGMESRITAAHIREMPIPGV